MVELNLDPFMQSEILQVLGMPGANIPILQAVRESKQKFMRSSSHIARFVANKNARVLTAWECVYGFKYEVLAELAERTTVPIIRRGGEISPTLKAGREALGVTEQQLENSDHRLRPGDIRKVELNKVAVPVHILTRISEALALQDYALGATYKGGGDADLAYRLKGLLSQSSVNQRLSPTTVLALTEAAWVTATQVRLKNGIDGNETKQRIKMGGNGPVPLGHFHNAPWKEGYELAHRTREMLGISPNEPIHHLDHLISKKIDTPVIQTSSAGGFAGATISNNGVRGIVVNTNAYGGNVWIRRMTLAHEMAHLLWDTDEVLRNLCVDNENILDSNSQEINDEIEARANAFAIEFLAPREELWRMYMSYRDKTQAMVQLTNHFGVGFTALSWHLKNASTQYLDRASLRGATDCVPSDEWKAEVSATTDFFLFPETPAVRTGEFAKTVALAVQENLISMDTAREYLKMKRAEVEDENIFGEQLNQIANLA
jgi:Zn-dependent peptidase ImmA (M78 family)